MLEEGCGIYEIAGGKMLFYFLAGVLSLFLTYFLAFTLFGIPLRGSFFYVVILGLFFYLAVVSAGLFMGLFCRNQMESMQMSMLAAYPSFLLTGYTWPAAAMPKILAFLGKFLPLTYFAGNIRDIALMGAGFEVLQKDLAALVMLSLAYLFIAIYLYRRRLLKEGYDPGEIRV